MALSNHSLQQPARGYSNPQRGIPGPNAYNIQSSFINKHDFNVGVSRVFRLPAAVQLDGPKHKTPAPNQYDVCMWITQVAFRETFWYCAVYPVVYVFVSSHSQVTCGSRERLCAVAGTSAFLSKTGRDAFYPHKNVPSPCNYLFSLSCLSKVMHIFIFYSVLSYFVFNFLRPLWGKQPLCPAQLQGSLVTLQIHNSENPCSSGQPCAWSRSL